MSRPVFEVADIFRDHGPSWRDANRGHVSLDQLKVMSAIERCRTAELGGHVARCENGICGHTLIAYNSCRNRHCPKCQGAQARDWLADREAELLPVPYFHVVYTLPSELRDIAYQNKRVIYDILMRAAVGASDKPGAVHKRLAGHGKPPVGMNNALRENKTNLQAYVDGLKIKRLRAGSSKQHRFEEDTSVRDHKRIAE